jgi:hypothetical protein
MGAASTMRRDHFDPIRRHQDVVEMIAVVAEIPNQSCGDVGEEARVEGGRDEVWLIR